MFCIVQRNSIPAVSSPSFGIGSNQLLTCKLQSYKDLGQALRHNICAFKVKRDLQNALTSKKIDSTSTFSDQQIERKNQIEGTDQEFLFPEENKGEETNKEIQKIVVQKNVKNTKGKQVEQNQIIPRKLIRRTKDLSKTTILQQKNDQVSSNSTPEYVNFLAIIPKLRKIENKEMRKKIEKLFDRKVEEWALADQSFPTKRQRFSKKFQ